MHVCNQNASTLCCKYLKSPTIDGIGLYRQKQYTGRLYIIATQLFIKEQLSTRKNNKEERRWQRSVNLLSVFFPLPPMAYISCVYSGGSQLSHCLSMEWAFPWELRCYCLPPRRAIKKKLVCYFLSLGARGPACGIQPCEAAARSFWNILNAVWNHGAQGQTPHPEPTIPRVISTHLQKLRKKILL